MYDYNSLVVRHQTVMTGNQKFDVDRKLIALTSDLLNAPPWPGSILQLPGVKTVSFLETLSSNAPVLASLGFARYH